MMKTWKTLFTAALLTAFAAQAQAGAIDALYDVELKQVTKSDQNQAIGDSPAAILSNKTALDASYSLKEDGSKNGVDYVLATPKKNNAGYQFIRIGFKGDTLAAMVERQLWQPNQHQLWRRELKAQFIARRVYVYSAQRRGCVEPVV